MTDIEIVNGFYSALIAGDLASALLCLHPEAVGWHNYDNLEMPLASIAEMICSLGTKLERLDYIDRRYEQTSESVVARQVLEAVMPNGTIIKVPAMFHISLKNGLIARLEEYVDTASIAPLIAFAIGEELA